MEATQNHPRRRQSATGCSELRSIEQSVIQRSITRAGFSADMSEWHISRHDVFGERFRCMWNSNLSETVDAFEVHASDVEDDHNCIENTEL